MASRVQLFATERLTARVSDVLESELESNSNPNILTSHGHHEQSRVHRRLQAFILLIVFLPCYLLASHCTAL